MHTGGAVNKDRGSLVNQRGQSGKYRSDRRAGLRIGRFAIDERAPDPGESHLPNSLTDLLRPFPLGEKRDDVRYTELRQASYILASRAVA